MHVNRIVRPVFRAGKDLTDSQAGVFNCFAADIKRIKSTNPRRDRFRFQSHDIARRLSILTTGHDARITPRRRRDEGNRTSRYEVSFHVLAIKLDGEQKKRSVWRKWRHIDPKI